MQLSRPPEVQEVDGGNQSILKISFSLRVNPEEQKRVGFLWQKFALAPEAQAKLNAGVKAAKDVITKNPLFGNVEVGELSLYEKGGTQTIEISLGNLDSVGQLNTAKDQLQKLISTGARGRHEPGPLRIAVDKALSGGPAPA